MLVLGLVYIELVAYLGLKRGKVTLLIISYLIKMQMIKLAMVAIAAPDIP